MELLYIGHAGILVRHDDAMIAIDPFLSGSFYWRGKENIYKGNSPWIGQDGQMDKFIETFGGKITAIAITHAHLDHFDPPAIFKILERNPQIQMLVPYPVSDWIKASSMFDEFISQFTLPVEWHGTYEVEAKNETLIVDVLPNPGIPKERNPYRVGYLIRRNGEKTGICHPGDAHKLGDWDHVQDRVKQLITWCPERRKLFLEYFKKDAGGKLEKVWWIHWERFEPGNFTCSEDPNVFMNETKELGISTGLLDYKKWATVD